MQKVALRKLYKEKRSELTINQIEDLSLQVANRLLELPIWDKIYYHLFLSITESKEIQTEYILHILHAKDKEIVVSKSIFKTLEMKNYLLTDNTKIVKSKYNIPEPEDGIEVPEDKLEVIFIPLLAFDSKGNRVGYGAGFYDKMLAKCKPNCIKVGLSFFEPTASLINDIHSNDIILDYCVTPEKIYQF